MPRYHIGQMRYSWYMPEIYTITTCEVIFINFVFEKLKSHFHLVIGDTKHVFGIFFENVQWTEPNCFAKLAKTQKLILIMYRYFQISPDKI